MTCIAAVIEKNGSYMASDSCVTQADMKNELQGCQKIFHLGPMMIGVSGGFRIMQIVRHRLCIPPFREDDNEMRYMCVDFIDALRDAIQKNGMNVTENGCDSMNLEGRILLVFRHHIYSIGNNYSVLLCDESYAAIGCGYEVATGALYATATVQISSVDRLKHVIGAAIHHCNGVGGTIHIISSEKKELPDATNH